MSDSLQTLAALISGQLNPVDLPVGSLLNLADRALRHQVGPLLQYRLDAAGVTLPSASQSRMVRAAQQVAAHHLALGLAQQQADAALRAGGLSPIWIKGIVLAYTVYPQPYLRPMSDLDMLISPDERLPALEALAAIGYALPGKSLAQRWAEHHDHLRGGPAGAIILELHTRLVADEALLPADGMRWFFAQTIPYSVDRCAFLTLTPSAHLLYLCAHSQLQHQFSLLRWSFDLHQLIQAGAPDWPTVIEQAVCLRWTAAVERALVTCQEYFGTMLPAGLLDELRAARSPDEDPAKLDTYRGPGGRWRKTRERLASLPPGDRLRWLARLIWPSPDYLRRRHALPPGRPLWTIYLARWRAAARDIIAALRKST